MVLGASLFLLHPRKTSRNQRPQPGAFRKAFLLTHNFSWRSILAAAIVRGMSWIRLVSVRFRGAALLATVGLLLPSARAATRPPDILFIAIDDLNDWANCLGGRPGVLTPNIDRLAARGTLFLNANCAAPVCNPSRTATMTGIRPSTSGIYNNNQKWRLSPVLNQAVTIPEHFRQHGYAAKGGGKIFHALEWFDGDVDGWNDPKCWDEYFPTKLRQMPPRVLPPNPPKDGKPDRKQYGVIPYFDWQPLPNPDSDMPDYKVVDWAIGELKKTQDKPLFLAVGLFRPHIPWYVPKKYYDLYPLDQIKVPYVKPGWLEKLPPAAQQSGAVRRKWHQWVLENHEWEKAVQGYLASISFCDAQVGRLLDALDASGKAAHTIIVLWTDHGFHAGDKETWEKFTLWEEATRVPLIFVAPGVTRPGARCARPASLLDIYPTLVELAGHAPRKELEGRSLVSQLREPQAPRDEPALCTHERNNHSVRSERFHYIRYANGDEELYDHAGDEGEWNSLAGDPTFAAVKTDLAKWLPKVNVETRLLPDTGEFPGPEQTKSAAKAVKQASARPSGALKAGDVFSNEDSPQIAGKPLTLTAEVEPSGPDGVIVAQGGNVNGYALYLKDGKLAFTVRVNGKATTIVASETPAGRFTAQAHLASTGATGLAINERQVAAGQAPGLIPAQPNDGLSVGNDAASLVGEYEGANEFSGKILNVRLNVE